MRRHLSRAVHCVALVSILCQLTAAQTAQRPPNESAESNSRFQPADNRAARASDNRSVPKGGQLGSTLKWISVPGADDRFFLGQSSRDGRWILTPNEAFFPKLGLRAIGIGTVPDQDGLNKGEAFEAIGDWDSGDTAQWGVFAARPGDVTWKIWMASKGNAGRFELRLGNTVATFAVPDTDNESKPVASGKLTMPKTGMHAIDLHCLTASPSVRVMAIEISGAPVQGGAVLRKRWRPAAAHTRFRSSQNPGSVRLWVMEMDAVPGDLPFYSPITTPFGYYGPTWRADGTVNASFNFSLWSFGRGKESPPIEHLSHLLAVGSPKAIFGGFDHEGTGVKVRNWEPLSGRQGQRQALALRVEPGETHDTYYSYFYANDEGRWRLFGVGNKFNQGKPLNSLWVGSFVEVPGRASVQRSGAYPRVMRYRGWVMDKAGKWYTLDRMKRGNVDRESKLTHTRRGITDDGWFFLQTGGWEFRRPATSEDVVATSLRQPREMPFLTPNDVQTLTSMPSSISQPELIRHGDEVEVQFRVHNGGDAPAVTLYWGEEEALTFADRWKHSEVVATPEDGKGRFRIRDWPSHRPLWVRARLDNEAGKFWSASSTYSR